jgi:hypothetical protein
MNTICYAAVVIRLTFKNSQRNSFIFIKTHERLYIYLRRTFENRPDLVSLTRMIIEKMDSNLMPLFQV